jgi:hypothetical protein
MTTKKVLLALAATSLLAFGSVAPAYAEDPPPADEGAKMDVPADPDSVDPGDSMADPGTDEGAADQGTGDKGTGDKGTADPGTGDPSPPEGEPQ